jgi:[ribosomal protein S5]-alanine N-acetyltransferase
MKTISFNTIVNTDRLVLLPVSDNFKSDIHKEFTLEVTRFMPFNPNDDIRTTEAFIERCNEDLLNGKGIQFCILKKETNEFLGCCGLHHTDTKAVEIGLWIKKSVHGNGYGTEVVKALVDLAEKNLDIDYLFYPVDKNNLASRKIPEKLGFIQAMAYEKKKSESEMLNIIELRKYIKPPFLR